MASETIVAVYDSAARAKTILLELEAAGIPTNRIKQYENGASPRNENVALGHTTHRGFWSWLLGEEAADTDHSAYDRALESGGTVVTVITEPHEADRVTSILEAHSPLHLQEHGSEHQPIPLDTSDKAGPPTLATPNIGQAATEAGSTRSETLGKTSPTREQVVPLAEEQLQVGKRAVERGTTRVRRYVVERPVDQQVRLRDEAVSIERRPVTEAASVTPDAFTEKTVEVTETHEEPVVSRTAKVVEEVVVGKRADERVETVHEKVRREEVDVERPMDRPVGSKSPSGTP